MYSRSPTLGLAISPPRRRRATVMIQMLSMLELVAPTVSRPQACISRGQ